MQIQENFSLKHYNSFGIDAKARYFGEFTTVDELGEGMRYQVTGIRYEVSGMSGEQSAVSGEQSGISGEVSGISGAQSGISDQVSGETDSKPQTTNHKLQTSNYKPQTSNSKQLILGGGSNILLTKDYDGIVLKNGLKGIELIKEDEEYFYVKAAAGENWHRFVLHCIANNYAGIENLSLIPGNVGAAPMQNIGAYGVELKDVFEELEAYNIEDGTIQKFSLQNCEFGYRESVFKKQYKGLFVILNVSFRLRKHAVFNTSYGAVEQELEAMGVRQLSIKAISQAVINIRSSKLPDPAVIGNAGSFFKNPEIAVQQFVELTKKFAGLVGYALPNNKTKLAAGWLIEQCGWKGYRLGDAGCHAKQALVLVNYGNAKGEEILELSERIIKSVEEKYGVTLEREVNVV